MKINQRIKKILLILILFSMFSPIHEIDAESMTNQRLVPFIGMVVDYTLNVKIIEPESFPLFVAANWTVTWEQYDPSTPDIFISNLTVRSLFMIPISPSGYESGIIIENITSRRVLSVELPNAPFLQILNDTYFSPDQPNYTPFYINTTELSVSDIVSIYSFNMTVIEIAKERVADFGDRDLWFVQVNSTEPNVIHSIKLAYDNTTGVLVGGNLNTHQSWRGGSRTYEVEIILRHTNALTRHEVIIEVNRILVLVICCVPIVISFPKLLRVKEIKGGL
jgi:hypothetical protein